MSPRRGARGGGGGRTIFWQTPLCSLECLEFFLPSTAWDSTPLETPITSRKATHVPPRTNVVKRITHLMQAGAREAQAQRAAAGPLSAQALGAAEGAAGQGADMVVLMTTWMCWLGKERAR